MKLSARLQMNADMVPAGSRVADIGCDHGYVSIYLTEKKICSNVIALDVREGPLSMAQKNIIEAGLASQIECRLSDGVNGLEPGETDTLLIAGMGGMLVCRILNQSRKILSATDTLVLQPQSDFEQIRRQLPALGFCIVEEQCCFDGGKWYLGMRAVRGQEGREYTEAEYRYGWILPEGKDPEYHKFLLYEKEKAEKILVKLEEHSTSASISAYTQVQHTICLLTDRLSLYGCNII